VWDVGLQALAARRIEVTVPGGEVYTMALVTPNTSAAFSLSVGGYRTAIAESSLKLSLGLFMLP
jgi:hypothetical protein